MLSSLRWRLTAAFLFVSLLGLGTAAVLSHTVTQSEFDRLRAEQKTDEFEALVLDYYADNGTLDGFDAFMRSMLTDRLPLPPPSGDVPNPERPPPDSYDIFPRDWGYLLISPDGIALTSAGPVQAGDEVDAAMIARGSPVEADGTQIATLVDMQVLPELDPLQKTFLARTDQALMIASLVAGGVALVAGAVLARGLTQPLTHLTHALAKIGQDQPVPELDTRIRGEVGQLIRAFNRMSADLTRSNQLRKQMTADIAHELRSPLAVINGYIEGMRDGTLPPTAERYDAIYEETQLLRHLIDDLRTLSLADSGELPLRLEEARPTDLLADIQRSFAIKAQQQGVALEIDTAPDLPPVKVDRARMMQVLGNLMHNALRYTPESGKITLTARRSSSGVELRVEDTGKGIPAEKLPNLFQRFYRVEDDREQAEGQTGIGLAIVKALVDAQGGSVRAESRGLGHGSVFTVQLPLV